MLQVNVARVYANTFCESGSLLLLYLPTLIRHVVAILNERVREEYRARSYVAPSLGMHNRANTDNTFHLSERRADVEVDAMEAQQSVWMDTTQPWNPADKMGDAGIQADRSIVVSDL